MQSETDHVWTFCAVACVSCIYVYTQIADFGMSRDLADETYYVSSGGMIPIKWTAPEVGYSCIMTSAHKCCLYHRLYTIRSTPQPVMCGVLGVSCMRYGVSDTNHLKTTLMLR